MEPVSSILAGWAVGKVADALWTATGSEIQSRFKKTDLTAAIEAGKQAVAAWEQPQPDSQRLFYHCPPKEAQDFLTAAFTHSSVQEELQRPLKQEGEPQISILCLAFRQVAATKPTKLNADALEPWLQVFVRAYVVQTSYHLKVRVAQQHYLTQLIDRLDDHRFLGMAVEGGEVDRVGKLVEIFVMPDVQEERSSRWAEELLLERQAQLLQEQRSRSLRDRSGRTFSAAQLVTTQGRRRSVLLGDPGSGKTSLVSYFAVTLADAMQKQLQAAAMPLRSDTKALQGNTKALRPVTLPLRPDTEGLRSNAEGLQPDTEGLLSHTEGLQPNTEALLPILVRIREWARHPHLSLLDYLRQFAEDSLCVKPLPADFFEYWLDRGQALVLLDGLDEVADEAKRRDIVEEIQSFLGKYPRSRVIITSRPAGYRSDFFRTEEFPHYELQRFDDDKMNEFIDRWYDSRIDEPQERQRRKESLRKALNDTDRIKLLARNPLLLTIVALIHRYQAVLPKQRHKLYEKAVDTLITNWDQNKELSNHTVLKYLDSDDLKRLMESLAYWIHTQGNTGDSEGGTLIDRAELHQQLSRLIKEQKSIELYQAREEAKRFLDFVCDRTGLLNEQGQDCYAFVHKTFQEYLTAQEINYQRDNDDFDVVLTHIDNHLHDPHWREVLLLTIAQQAPKKAAIAIRRIVNANSPYEQWLHRDLLFAGCCLTENVKGLKAADAKLSSEVLMPLLELEVSNANQIGSQIRSQTLKILCSLNETEFETETLQLIKAKADSIEKDRLRKYRSALGEETAVIAELLQRLEDEDAKVRLHTVFALVELGSAIESVVQALLQRLEDEDSDVRLNTPAALGRLSSTTEPIVQTLLQQLEGEDSRMRWAVAETLGKLGSTSELVVQALLQRLENEDARVRWIAAATLGNLNNTTEPVVQALLQRLEDEDIRVRSNTASTLVKLSSATELVVQALLQQLKEENSEVRWRAALALGNTGKATEPVIQALLQRLEDQDSEVRWRAAKALDRLGNTTEPVVQALLQRFEDSGARWSAISELGNLSNATEPVVQALLQRLEDGNSEMRWSAASALGNLGNATEPVVQALSQRLEDEDFEVRSVTAWALSNLGNATEPVVQALLQQLEDSEVRWSAAWALGKLGKTNDSIQPLIIQWIEQHQDSDNEGCAIDALWAIVEG